MGGGMSCQSAEIDETGIIIQKRAYMAALLKELIAQDWCLKPESLDFFYELWSENETVLLTLLAQLKTLCDPNDRAISLKADHVDTVIASHRKSLMLSKNVPSHLKAYLAQNRLDVQSPRIEDVIQHLRIQHAPALVTQAEQYHLKHHTFYHALEIKVRAMHVLTKQLGLLSTQSDEDIFLREIVSFLIEFHDHEQKNCGPFTSVEQATAARTATWIVEALDLANHAPHLISVIEVIADWIIVLGTTMIWGPTSTMDLSELYFLFDDATIQANMHTHHDSNQPLIALLGVIALVTGVCDKNPASIAPLMEAEANQMNGLACLKKVMNEPSMLQSFLESKDHPMPSYFSYGSRLSQQQAWLTTWVPHLNMRAEISVSDPAVTADAVSLIQWMTTYQHKRAEEMDDAPLDVWLAPENMPKPIHAMIESVFFLDRTKETDTNGMKTLSVVSGLSGEINFSKSQVASLNFVRKQMPYLLFLLDKRSFAQAAKALGIEATVPLTDVEYLNQLRQFYFNCTAVEKVQLMQELFFISVLQIGTEYALQPELFYQSILAPDGKMNASRDSTKPTLRRNHFDSSISEKTLSTRIDNSFFSHKSSQDESEKVSSMTVEIQVNKHDY